MKNIKLIKTILAILVVLFGGYSLLTRDFTYQTLQLLLVGALLFVIGVEEKRKGKSRRRKIVSLAAVFVLAIILIHFVTLFVLS